MDSPDAGVICLLIPGVLALPLFIAKAIAVFMVPQSVFIFRWKSIGYAALAESALPAAVLLVQAPFLLTFLLAIPSFDQRWFRISFFLTLLYLGSGLVNYFILFGNMRRPERRVRVPDLSWSLVLGILNPAVFVSSWISLGKYLNHVG